MSFESRDALPDHAPQQIVGALLVVHLERDAVVVSEIKFGQVAVQVFPVAVLVHASHAPIEHTEEAFNGVGVCIARTYSPMRWFTVW